MPKRIETIETNPHTGITESVIKESDVRFSIGFTDITKILGVSKRTLMIYCSTSIDDLSGQEELGGITYDDMQIYELAQIIGNVIITSNLSANPVEITLETLSHISPYCKTILIID